jgi:uncharacterized protein YaeQ
MALKATIFKADLSLADIDRGYYADHALTLARHPSETDERLMVRLVAFALFAHERLEFGRGLSSEDEPALWQRDLTGAIEQWIEVGLPDERQLRKASGRAQSVFVLTYGGRAAELWWAQNRDRLERIRNLTVFNLPFAATQELAKLATRTMNLHCTIQEGDLVVNDGTRSVHCAVESVLRAN